MKHYPPIEEYTGCNFGCEYQASIDVGVKERFIPANVRGLTRNTETVDIRGQSMITSN